MGSYAWRPPSWWVVAFAVFSGSAIYFLRRRAGFAFSLALAAIFVTGALAIQARHSRSSCDANIMRFGDDEILVIAHVIAEGNLRDDGTGGLRQRLDAETEQISTGDQQVAARCGIRLSIYQERTYEWPNSCSYAPV